MLNSANCHSLTLSPSTAPTSAHGLVPEARIAIVGFATTVMLQVVHKLGVGGSVSIDYHPGPTGRPSCAQG
jgi:hypothetical protein